MAGASFYRRWALLSVGRGGAKIPYGVCIWGTLLRRAGVRRPECGVRRFLSTVGRWAMFAMRPARAGNLDRGSQRMTQESFDAIKGTDRVPHRRPRAARETRSDCWSLTSIERDGTDGGTARRTGGPWRTCRWNARWNWRVSRRTC
jgi:hypothetical protein